MSPSSSQVPLFEQVKRKFDIHRLQSDLEEIGQIDPRDWEFLKGVLCGLDQGEIAKQCHVEKETVKVALSRHVRLHILHLFPDKKNVDWKRLPGWLIEAGYGIGENHRVNWQQVCRTMLDRQKKLSTNEVIASEAMQFDLLDDEIFISLALVERKEPERLSQNVHPARPIEQYEEKPPIEYEQFREQILRQGNSDRIAIVGEPGAGKTTLLQHIAFWILDKELGLPIWISLGDLIKNGDLQRLKDYLTQVWLDDAVLNVTQDVKSDFLKQLNEQRVWLLLDGADEIVASSGIALREINNQLRGWLSQSCIILTCRINVWEVDINALRDFQTYRTKEFHYPTQVEQFIESGFRKSNQQSGERLKTELANTERTRLQQLVRNPLRLMMLCTTWHEQESLPATKAELYKRFVSEFYKWNRSKWKKKDLNYAFFPNTVAKQEKLNKALGRLACRALDEESSPFRLLHNLVSDELGDPDEDGSDFWLALNLGWLQVARDSDKPSDKVYTFFHPTFQEYFAACAIDDWRYFLNHVRDNPMQGTYRIFEPQWKEVILLWLGREGNKDVTNQKEEFIEALVKFEDGWDGFYRYHAYFLASAGVTELVNYSRANEILIQLFEWGFASLNLEKHAFDIEPQKFQISFNWHKPGSNFISELARKALRETEYKRAITLLTKHLEIYQNIWKIEPDLLNAYNQGQIDISFKNEVNDYARELRVLIAYTLGKISPKNSDAIYALTEEINTLIEELGTNEDKNLKTIEIHKLIKAIFCVRTACMLFEINPGNPNAIKVIKTIISRFLEIKIDLCLDEIVPLLSQLNFSLINPKSYLDIWDLIPSSSSKQKIGQLEYINLEDLEELAANLNLQNIILNAPEHLIVRGVTPKTPISEILRLDLDKQTLCAIVASLRSTGKERCLGEADIADVLVHLLCNNQDSDIRFQVTYSLKAILTKELFSVVINAMKNCWQNSLHRNDIELYRHCYGIIWNCAQNMPYPDFYQAWNQTTTHQGELEK